MSTTRSNAAETYRGIRPQRRAMLSYRLVKLVSWGFVGLALVLAGIFVIEIARFEATAPSRPEAGPSRPPSDQIVASETTLTGFDRYQEPYKVTAVDAVQDSVEPDLVHLNTVTGELRRRSGDVFNLTARRALYDSSAKTLDLEGDVRLGADDRFVARMERAQVTLDDKRFRSESLVVATFDRGRITAGGLEISNDGDRIVFFNRANAVFQPHTDN